MNRLYGHPRTPGEARNSGCYIDLSIRVHGRGIRKVCGLRERLLAAVQRVLESRLDTRSAASRAIVAALKT